VRAKTTPTPKVRRVPPIATWSLVQGPANGTLSQKLCLGACSPPLLPAQQRVRRHGKPPPTFTYRAVDARGAQSNPRDGPVKHVPPSPTIPHRRSHDTAAVYRSTPTGLRIDVLAIEFGLRAFPLTIVPIERADASFGGTYTVKKRQTFVDKHRLPAGFNTGQDSFTTRWRTTSARQSAAKRPSPSPSRPIAPAKQSVQSQARTRATTRSGPTAGLEVAITAR
jgi:hypothetical protein